MSTPTTIEAPNAAVAEALHAYAQAHQTNSVAGIEYQTRHGQWQPCDRVPALFRRTAAHGLDAGEGYRLLAVGEAIQKGDEYLNDWGSWKPRKDAVGIAVESYFMPTRRRVVAQQPTPEPGFRLLGSGDVLQDSDHYFSPYSNRWYGGQRGVEGEALADKLKRLPEGAAFARCIQPAFTNGQTVEVLHDGTPWCRNGSGEWVRDFSRPLLTNGEQYRTVVEDHGHAVALDDGYAYPHSALQAVKAKWRPWSAEEALGQKITFKAAWAPRLYFIALAGDRGVYLPLSDLLESKCHWSYEDLLADFEQLDGSPCGVLEGYEAV